MKLLQILLVHLLFARTSDRDFYRGSLGFTTGIRSITSPRPATWQRELVYRGKGKETNWLVRPPAPGIGVRISSENHESILDYKRYRFIGGIYIYSLREIERRVYYPVL